MTDKTKKIIDDLILGHHFPTPKNMLYILRTKHGIENTEEIVKYVWQETQIALEAKMFELTHPSQINAILRYLQRNFPDWDENTKEIEQQDVINITFNLENESGNKI